MVTPKPVTEGHVIICPQRTVEYLKDLNELEVLELFVTAKEVAKTFEEKFRVKNFIFLI
jgi:diadenosine tetraphosphate (Ap4A) HIT family hydrolase